VAVVRTADAQLLTNQPLPPLARLVTARRFFVLAPFALCLVQLFLLYSFQRLRARLDELPALFPEGRTALEEVSGGLVGILFTRPGDVTWRSAAGLLAGWCVPATAFVLWLRCLPLRDWTMAVSLTLLVTLSVCVTLFFSPEFLGGQGEAEAPGGAGRDG
jgi:hypothetical protein